MNTTAPMALLRAAADADEHDQEHARG